MSMKIPLAVFGSCILAAASAQAAVLHFENAAAYTDNFDPTTNYGWSNSAGVGGAAGRVDSLGNAGSGNANRTYYETAYSWSEDGNTLHLSVYFLGQAASSSTLLRQGVGLSSGTTTNFLTGGSATVAWRLIKSGSSNFSFDFKYGAGGSDALSISSANFNLLTDQWYRLGIVLTRSDTENAFSFDAALENWGSTGSTLVSTVASASGVEFTNAGLYSATGIYAGLAAADINGGFKAFDAFYLGSEAIPEPRALLLLGLGMVGVICVRKRFSAEGGDASTH